MPDVPIRFHLLAMYLRVCACTSHVHGALMHPNNCPKMTRMLLFLIKPTSCAFIQFVSQCFTSFFASRRVAVLWSIKSGAVRSQPIPDTVSDTSISHRSQSDAYRAYEKVQLVTCCHFTASRRGLHIGEYWLIQRLFLLFRAMFLFFIIFSVWLSSTTLYYSHAFICVFMW